MSSTSPFDLELAGVAKAYGPNLVLDEIDLTLSGGQIVGLCGENGAGKSTLVKIICGLVKADGGNMSLGGEGYSPTSSVDSQQAGVALVDQELAVPPDLSVYDTIWLGHRDVPFFHLRKTLQQKARSLLGRLGLEHLDIDRRVGDEALGTRQLIEIARMLARDARILILDEPTAALTEIEINQTFEVLRRLADEGNCVILVTHRLDEVFELCDRAVVLRNGKLVMDEQTADIDVGTLIESMIGRSVEDYYPHAETATEEPAMEIQDFKVPGLDASIDLSVARGEVVGLAGQIGSGSDLVARGIAGLVAGCRGSITIGGNRVRPGSVQRAQRSGIVYLSDDRALEGVFLDKAVSTNLSSMNLGSMSRLGVINRTSEKSTTRDMAASVAIVADRVESEVHSLSGGNQQKAAIGRCLARPDVAVLVLHEPTRGVDVGARVDIYSVVESAARNGTAVLVVSSDLMELAGLCDRIVTMSRGRTSGTHVRPHDTNHILAEMTANTT